MTDAAKGPSATKADKNPKGGLSAAGRKKFGVQKGVTNYSGASRADKGRWVSWAMRFTGSPKPVKDSAGNPTRYALMFRAWGEKVPTSAADVQAVHAKAVKRSAELKKADKADLAEETMVDCADCAGFSCHFIENADRAFWMHVETHLEAPMTADVAHLDGLECKDPDCTRTFMTERALLDHAEAVHTFSDMERMVREAVREKYYVQGDYRANPVVETIWAWVQDMATDWVVYEVEKGGDSTLYKASYSLVDNVVTLGEGVEVVRKTVYEPVKKQES